MTTAAAVVLVVITVLVVSEVWPVTTTVSMPFVVVTIFVTSTVAGSVSPNSVVSAVKVFSTVTWMAEVAVSVGNSASRLHAAVKIDAGKVASSVGMFSMTVRLMGPGIFSDDVTVSVAVEVTVAKVTVSVS